MSTHIFDALGFDPAPGSPASVEHLATTLGRVGNQLNDSHSTLSRLGTSDGIWEGEAAAGFSKKVGALPKYLAEGHHSLIDAAAVLHRWNVELTDFQSIAARYESEAEEARRVLSQAENNPDLHLVGQTFATDEALQDAQGRIDYASKRVNEAQAALNHILKKAHDLLDAHAAAARAAAEAIHRAADSAPDEPGLFESFLDTLSNLGDELKSLGTAISTWLKEHADLIYQIGDWLGLASAACDVLALIFSETVIGAVVFEAIGMILNAAALGFHVSGWALGAKNGSWTDIGLDLVGFIPFGDVARYGKVGLGAFKGVKIPLNVAEVGAKASDALQRAGDIVDVVGGTARIGQDAAGQVARQFGVLGREVEAIHITADTFRDRLGVAVARHLGDANLYKAGTHLTDRAFQKMMPQLIEHTPLKHIPAIADSVRSVADSAGREIKYIDPRSWVARGNEAVTGAKDLYKEGVRYSSGEVDYLSDTVHEKVDQARNAIGSVASVINLFG
ncbi:putative T7SS-secreted protein [Streptomyces sp. NPDC051569]|uniref:putative T7SS-secreted protein n=1 Tax=Streptomyces sp. NPDC051569 TaxID=3365661 RepID=UPI003788718F